MLLAFCAGNSPVPVNSPHKGQWRRGLMFSLICAWVNDWVNNHEAGDLRRHRGHYDVNVMWRATVNKSTGWVYDLPRGIIWELLIIKCLFALRRRFKYFNITIQRDVAFKVAPSCVWACDIRKKRLNFSTPICYQKQFGLLSNGAFVTNRGEMRMISYGTDTSLRLKWDAIGDNKLFIYAYNFMFLE